MSILKKVYYIQTVFTLPSV